MTTFRPSNAPNDGHDRMTCIHDAYTPAATHGPNVGASGRRNQSEDSRQNVLTGIPSSYTLSATQTEETSEVNELMVKYFLNTLAEIALAVASRREAGK
ncbi:hypothetical protein ACFLWZ_05710 [Chloroflexota bacterium]